MALPAMSVLMVVSATFLTAVAQLLLKLGATASGFYIGTFPLNLDIAGGFITYFIAAGLFFLALRKGHLSLLYPLWSLSFVWVFFVSIFILGESVSLYNWIGILFIIVGVSFIGRAAEHA